MSSSDDLITGDLHRLAASHGHPRAVVSDVALRGHQPAVASDSAAVVRRSVDLAAATLAGRALFADRVARIAAGVAAAVVAHGGWHFVRDPRSAIEPVWNIGGSLMLVGVVYAVARAAAARRYNRLVGALSSHGEPAAVAAGIRSRVQRLDGPAVALAMAGLVLLLPVLGYYTGGPGDGIGVPFEMRPGASIVGAEPHGRMVVSVALIALAVILGVRVHRARGGIVALPGWVRLLASEWMAATGAVAGAAAIAEVLSQSAGEAGRAPGPNVFLVLGTALLSAWLPLWLSQRERSRLAEIAPRPSRQA